jgi:hypothetical protein
MDSNTGPEQEEVQKDTMPMTVQELKKVAKSLPAREGLEFLKKHWDTVWDNKELYLLYDFLDESLQVRYNPFDSPNPEEIERRMAQTGLPWDRVRTQMMEEIKLRVPFPEEDAWRGRGPDEAQTELLRKLGKAGPGSAYWNETRAGMSTEDWRYLLWWGIVKFYFPTDAQ